MWKFIKKIFIAWFEGSAFSLMVHHTSKEQTDELLKKDNTPCEKTKLLH